MVQTHKTRYPIRIVTAASLFDGHDAAINMIRRLLQDSGAEVIHLGHNRSVHDVVRAALQEGAQGICVSSYQGGHMEYFKYMKDLLDDSGASYVKIFGGGGGVIIHDEKKALENYGIHTIFHPDDGRKLGLQGMMNQILEACDFDILEKQSFKSASQELSSQELSSHDPASHISRHRESSPLSISPLNLSPQNSTPHDIEQIIPSLELGHALHYIESKKSIPDFEKMGLSSLLRKDNKKSLVLGITGTGGAGKSSLIDELVLRITEVFPNNKIAILCVDPTKQKTGGALLGDRIRMNAISYSSVYMRSLASRNSGLEVSNELPLMLDFLKQLDFDLIIAETSGIGQSSYAITQYADISMYVMTSDFGAQSQLEKIEMIDLADFIVINKADRRGAEDAFRDVSKQYKRAHKLFEIEPDQKLPLFLTQASRFNDQGVHELFFALVQKISHFEESKKSWSFSGDDTPIFKQAQPHVIIPSYRQHYLAEITQAIRGYKSRVKELSKKASLAGSVLKVKTALKSDSSEFEKLWTTLQSEFTNEEWKALEDFDFNIQKYKKNNFEYKVRDQVISQPMYKQSLSGTQVPRVCLPDLNDWGDRYRYLKLENVPGEFPYTAGVFPLKKADEEPKRMFAGEGTPERTNKRFHFLCEGESSHRLSTAFDSVTLYGNDPDLRPDIFGKIGESGVNICTLDDMKRLYEGFNLVDPLTSVSMTINGPAPMILAFFFNAAIDQALADFKIKNKIDPSQAEQEQIKAFVLKNIRGTVQADILKEDQGQNTCIFSTEFSLKMMGDIQQYFIKNQIRNFYSVSISGYHIAEAGANPISQLAFTLSNGFTFVEYYLSCGLKIDDFSPNLSFFFSNGLDAEYTVLGRVARRIWAIAMKEKYKADSRSQKLKYHIQTSGRSLHAQEIAFNDIRTTLQALIAIADNCNSLHTNAYDEAITTPTEESVRRAMAIQLIINREFGLSMNENPLQGSYFLEELTDLVEEAVLDVFIKISERGGVLGAMETGYQRSKIQEESLKYEQLKHNGQLPIIGVNTFVDPKTLAEGYLPQKIEMARATLEEKNLQLNRVNHFKNSNQDQAKQALIELKQTVIQGGNTFESLMKASRVCSLGQMTSALFEVGGQYRRNL